MKEKIYIQRIRFFCRSCNKEAIIQWLTFFSAEEITEAMGVTKEAQPKHCPWCGVEHQGEIGWDKVHSS